MPKPTKFTYEKKNPYRDASYFIIICEGKSREPDYFRFFVGISSRIKIVPVESGEMGSAPEKLIDVAKATKNQLDATANTDRIWFVIDTDRWRQQIRTLRDIAKEQKWLVAQSNPCFEVWLYYHAVGTKPERKLASCKNWKPFVAKSILGGFNSDFHAAHIKTAAINAEKNYSETGDLPDASTTQVFRLANELIPLIQQDLAIRLRDCPAPKLIGE